MTDLNDKVTIIIRSVGERTEQLCRELILAQGVAPANVVIIREAPFSAAMRKSFEIGIEYGRPWTFCVDADVLLRPGSVETMVSLAEEQAENVCEIQGYILDKFFGGPRHGGVHLYRTSLLPLALANIPAEGVNVRPEFHTLTAMKAQGYPYAIVRYLVGLHDFEQYYRDIFRKCFVQAHKHQSIAELFLSVWRASAAEDADYQVALQGFAAGVAHYQDVRIDIRQGIYKQQFAGLELDEKEAIQPNAFCLNTIEKIIASWAEPSIYKRYFPTKLGLVPLPEPEVLSLRERFIKHKSNMGLAKVLPYAIGSIMSRVGKKMQVWATDSQDR